MKTLATAAALFLLITSALAQTPPLYVRATNGNAYGNFKLPGLLSAVSLATDGTGKVVAGAGVTNPISNFYITTNFVSYQYVTNQYVSTNYTDYSYVTNLYVTTNTTFVSIITNLYVSNAFFTNISANRLTVNNFYTSDGTITNGIYFVTNAWAGPTNPIDLRLQDQYYDTLTPLSITGFQNRSNTVSQSVVLTIRNLSATNVTCFLAAGVRTALFTNSFTILPSTDAILSMKYSPSGPRTNAITQAFY